MSEQNIDNFNQQSSQKSLPPGQETVNELLQEVSKIKEEIKQYKNDLEQHEVTITTQQRDIKNQQITIERQQREIDRDSGIVFFALIALIVLFFAVLIQSWGDKEKSYGELIEKVDDLKSQLSLQSNGE